MHAIKLNLLTILLLLSFFAEAQQLQRNSFEIGAGIGRRGVPRVKEYVLRSTITAHYNIRINNLFNLKAGVDAIYYDRTDKYLYLATSYETWAFGAGLGTDFKMNKLIFTTGFYRYLYFKSQFDINYYTKIGFRYMLTPNLSAGFFMRAHKRQADYIDVGLSVLF